MGQNLILNAADHGFTVVAYNRTVSKVDHFLENEAKGKSILGAHSIEELVSKLKKPRRIMLLVKAGNPVDQFIDQLVPHLDEGDIIIDGGNSHFPDTNRRYEELKKKGILFVGSGVSGGEEGARYGPSLMPGGAKEAWPHIKDIFQSISAKADGEPCCDWVGDAGAGHYVKMVHNGIEYGDMQLICEAYDLMKRVGGMNDKEISDVFAEWNTGVLDSFLVEITRDILAYNDTDGTPIVEKILDTAGQKGTGKWTAINALDLGMPVTLIGEAVFARCLSALKSERERASTILNGPEITPVSKADRPQFVEDLKQALYASKIISYAQGFMLIREAAKEYGWVVLSDLSSLLKSPVHTDKTQILKTYFSTLSSKTLSTPHNPAGERLFLPLLLLVFQPQHSQLLFPSTMVTDQRSSQLTCCKLKETTLVLTLSKSYLNSQLKTERLVTTSTLTGLVRVVMSLLPLTKLKRSPRFLFISSS